MKKIITLIILLLLILLGLGPWITGYYIKENYLNLIANINQENQDAFIITVHDYSAGWMNSRVLLQLTPVKNNIPDMTFISVEQNIAHGPLIFVDNSKIPTLAAGSIQSIVRLPEQLSALLFSVGGNPQGQAVFNTLAYYDGRCVTQIHISPVNTSLFGMATLNWQGLNGTVSFKINLATDTISQIKSQLKVETLSLKMNDALGMGQNAEFLMQSLTQETNSTEQPDSLWAGHSEINIPAMSLKNATGLEFGLENFSFKGSTQVTTKNMFNFTNSLAIQKLELPHYTIPMITVLQYHLLVNNLNADELNNFITASKNAKISQMPSEEISKLVLPYLPRIITPSSTVNFDASFNTPSGLMVLKALAFWPANTPLPTTPDEIRVKANAKVDVRISIPLVMLLSEELSDAMAKNTELKLPSTPPVPASLNAPQTVKPSPSRDILKERVASLIQQGQLPLSSAIAIMTVYDQHPTPDVFKAQLDGMGLMPAVEMQLTQLYSQIVDGKLQAVSQAAPLSPPAPINQLQEKQQLASSLQEQFDQWVQQGYLIKDNNDYVTTIIYENEVVKVNGKLLPQDMTGTPPSMPQKAIQ